MPDQEAIRSKSGWIVARVLTPLCKSWVWLREWLRVLKPCRFSLLMVLAVLLFLIIASQGQDVLRALAERQAGRLDDSQRYLLFISTLA